MVGQTVSHYRVLRKLGSSGMGEVYEAQDVTLGRHIALKVLSSARPQDHDSVLPVRARGRAASALNHPHICTIHEFGEHRASPSSSWSCSTGRRCADR